MSKKLLILSDLHLSPNKRDLYRLSFLRDFIDIAKRRKPDCIIILGDLTEEKDRHTAWLVNQIIDWLYDLAKVAEVIILMGNHDYKSEGSPFFAFTRRLRNVQWIDAPTLGNDLVRLSDDFGRCLFLPHTFDHKRDWASLSHRIRAGDFDRIFAHNIFTGADLGSGKSADGISLAELGSTKQVISGDVHVPQRVGPVIYVGAPYRVDFGDEYRPRFIETETGNHKIKSIGVEAWPQKRLVEISKGSALARVEHNRGDIIKLRVHAKDMEAWRTIRTVAEAWAKDVGVILYQIEPILRKRGVDPEIKVAAPESDLRDSDILKQFAARHSLDEETLDAGLEIIK